MTTTFTARRVLALVAVLVLATPGAFAADVNEATEKAMKAASAKVAPTVVKIETAGGAEIAGGPAPKKGGPPAPGGGPSVRKGTGPTTGLIVDAEGYVVTSAFNFANRPTDIFVTIPGRTQRLVAKVVASDETRMLTLLKVDAKGLPVPDVFPKKDIDVGQWSIVLGRTSDPDTDHPPSMTVGIVSATNRIWGKAIQTDAKTSPVNYGGPLIAIDGRVYGVVVPASSRAEGETAGVDVYDGGIGFAVPLEDIMRTLPRMKQGQTLRRGMLGINPQSPDTYGGQVVIGAIQPDSAAARAGLQVGDKILEIDGHKVPHFSALQHVMGPKYDGDEVGLKVERGGKEQEFKGIKLLGVATAYVNAYLGLLPMRDDPGPGVEVRYVYPKSPADAAGIKVGDRVTKIGPATPAMAPLAPIQNRAALIAALQRFTPNTEIKIEIKRKEGDKVETVTAKLIPTPADLPEKLPLPSSAGKALEGQPKPKDKLPKDPFGMEAPEDEPLDCGQEPKKDEPKKDEPKKDEPKKDQPKVETGFMKRTNQGLGREYWVFVPDNYDRNKSYGVIVWFHNAGEGGKDGEKMARTFRDVCEDHNFIMVGPKSGNNDGWLPSETELVMQDVKAVLGEYTVDKTRVVAHGVGNGGQMAFYVAFNARDVFRGVGTVGAVLGTNPKDNVANQPLSFFISGGDKDPLIKDIKESRDLLLEKRFPVVFREMKESGKEYFDAGTFADFIAWLDSLDRV